jgi:uncharacterized protein (TIGR02217 family)
MSIPDYRLPEGIEKGAKGGPDFRTLIQESAAGQEQRVITWARCRAKYDIGYSILHSDDPLGYYQVVLALFYGHLGRAFPFRFKAWNDFRVDSELIGQGDGVTTQFQLRKTYDPAKILLGIPGPYRYSRDIVVPIASSLIITLVDTISHVETPTTAYTLAAGGLITLTSAPTSTTEVWWSGEFDLPMRFDVDHLPVVMNEADIVHIPSGSIQLREVIGEF